MISLCPNKNICGSCTWSEVSYPDQLRKKLELINKSFSDYGLNVVCSEIIPSPATSHYRNRMDFAIDYQGKVGLKEKGKWWRVIDNHTCFIGNAQIEKLFHPCREWIKNSGLSFCDKKTWKGLLEALVIRCTTSGQSMVNVVTSADFDEAGEKEISRKILELVGPVKPTTLIWSINHSHGDVSFGDEIKILAGSGFIEETINGLKYQITPNAFFQTNSWTAAVLQNQVLEFVQFAKADSVLDLYCGSGFFTVALAKVVKKILGIEIVAEAVDTAKTNARLNSVFAEFLCTKAEDLTWKEFNPDLVLVDPPRSGLHPKVLNLLLEKKPKYIIYVSCNYKKFSEEMVKLSHSYHLEKSIAIDMFPHTPHVELVSRLSIK